MAKTIHGWPTKIPGGQLAKRPAPTAKRAEYFGEYWQMEPHAYVYEFGGQWWLSAGGGPTPKDLYTIGPFSSKASLVIALEDDVLDGYHAGEMWVGHQRVLRKMAPSAGWMIDELQGKKKKKPSGRARTVPRPSDQDMQRMSRKQLVACRGSSRCRAELRRRGRDPRTGKKA